jgi:hypothetical protein
MPAVPLGAGADAVESPGLTAGGGVCPSAIGSCWLGVVCAVAGALELEPPQAPSSKHAPITCQLIRVFVLVVIAVPLFVMVRN